MRAAWLLDLAQACLWLALAIAINQAARAVLRIVRGL